MSEYEMRRRQFLQLLLVAPVGLVLSCGRKSSRAGELSPEESLKKLILLLGPWPSSRRDEAEEFADRLLASEVARGAYLPGSGALVQSLAGRFPDGTLAVDRIDLGALPPEERETLLALARQLYSLTETRFMMCGQPPVGECQGDATLHTRAPA